MRAALLCAEGGRWGAGPPARATDADAPALLPLGRAAGVQVAPDGCCLSLKDAKGGATQLRARLVLDCMGHQSPIMQQIR